MRRLILSALLVTAVCAAFAPVARHQFVGFDDPSYVTDNPSIRQGLTAGTALWALTTYHASNWHPLSWISHALDVSLFGMDPRGHHLVNLALHAGVACAFFLVGSALTGRTAAAFLAALIFALHPLQVEVVAWVAERKELLATLLMLASLSFWTAHLRTRNVPLYAAALGAHALALLAKPTAVVFPALLLLVDAWPLGRWRTVRPSRLLLEKTPFMVLSAAAGLLTLVAQQQGGALATIQGFPPWNRLSWVPLHYLWYLGKAVFPTNLAVFYPQTSWPAPGWQFAASLAGLAAASALILRARTPALGLGWAWFLVALLPVSGLFQVGGQAVANRYFYLPSLGLLLGLAAAASGATRRPRGILLLLAILLAAGSGVLTRQEVGYWSDSATLMNRALAVTTNNYIAHDNLGGLALRAGRREEAVHHFREGVRARRALGRSMPGR